ncbi:YciI family protein [Microbacterium neungamense]|uniref:YciI family protein n=1 Tax=Microbacterium neungamense TaxID=2810535 RepID=UPI00217D540F|nr:YciI family protein [Microbacterium neungamense]
MTSIDGGIVRENGEKMKYALLIYDTPDAWSTRSEAEVAEVMSRYAAVGMDAATVGREQLQLPQSATTVRIQDGRELVTDGPFVESKEYLGGFYLVDVPDLDAAMEIARRIPAASEGGAIEIRPVVERTG